MTSLRPSRFASASMGTVQGLASVLVYMPGSVARQPVARMSSRAWMSPVTIAATIRPPVRGPGSRCRARFRPAAPARRRARADAGAARAGRVRRWRRRRRAAGRGRACARPNGRCRRRRGRGPSRVRSAASGRAARAASRVVSSSAAALTNAGWSVLPQARRAIQARGAHQRACRQCVERLQARPAPPRPHRRGCRRGRRRPAHGALTRVAPPPLRGTPATAATTRRLALGRFDGLRFELRGDHLARLRLRVAPERDVFGDVPAMRAGAAAGNRTPRGNADAPAGGTRACAGAARSATAAARSPASAARSGAATRRVSSLVQGDAIGRATLRFGRHARPAPADCIRSRQYAGHSSAANRNAGVTGLSFADARVGAAQRLRSACAQRAAAVGGERLRGFGQEHRQQAVSFEALETAHGVAGEEHLQRFVEQARRRGFAQQRRQRAESARRSPGSIVKSSFAARRTARSMRTGSSR